MTRMAADTAFAAASVRRCERDRLLPGDEAIVDATRDLLNQVRIALGRKQTDQAITYARNARQLASSLSCR